jgi:hypothetical protein
MEGEPNCQCSKPNITLNSSTSSRTIQECLPFKATGVALLQSNAMSTGKPAQELVQAAAQTARASGFKV